MRGKVVQNTRSQLPTNGLFTTFVLHTFSFTYSKLGNTHSRKPSIHSGRKCSIHSTFMVQTVRLKGGDWRLVGVEQLMGDRTLPRPIDNTVRALKLAKSIIAQHIVPTHESTKLCGLYMSTYICMYRLL